MLVSIQRKRYYTTLLLEDKGSFHDHMESLLITPDRSLLGDSKFVDEGVLSNNLLLPVALDFAKVPSGRNIATSQVVRLS
jgi:hypothetical protein